MLPEGRINMTDRLMLAGRPGAVLVALKARVPILPCYIEGAPYDRVPNSPFFMPAKVKVHFGRPLDLAEFHDRETDEQTLREVLRRGLAADPNERFASMDALVDAVERAGRRPRRLALAVGLAAATAVVAVALPWIGNANAAPCGAVDSALTGIWDPPRREEVERALAGTSAAYARETTATEPNGVRPLASTL